MKLTTEQQRVFSDWVHQKMEHHSCQLCQSNQWKIGELMPNSVGTAIDEFDAAAAHGLVQLVCQNCGNVLLFDAHHIQGWGQHDTSHSAVM
jgi:hypothetical protein